MKYIVSKQLLYHRSTDKPIIHESAQSMLLQQQHSRHAAGKHKPSPHSRYQKRSLLLVPGFKDDSKNIRFDEISRENPESRLPNLQANLPGMKEIDVKMVRGEVTRTQSGGQPVKRREPPAGTRAPLKDEKPRAITCYHVDAARHTSDDCGLRSCCLSLCFPFALLLLRHSYKEHDLSGVQHAPGT